jgi:hypothetical protein
MRAFQSSILWTINVFVGVTAGLTAAIALPVAAVIFWQDHIDPRILVFLFANALLVYLAYFPGNLGVFWPYAVEIGPNDCIRLHGPFKKLSIPISEIGEIENSVFWQGFVVHLAKPHGALTQFVIPWFFGSNRKTIIDTIQQTRSQSIP